MKHIGLGIAKDYNGKVIARTVSQDEGRLTTEAFSDDSWNEGDVIHILRTMSLHSCPSRSSMLSEPLGVGIEREQIQLHSPVFPTVESGQKPRWA